jgi:glucosamine--fructose-6-phosphate aminotransferase (isomerizing)
VCGIVGITAHPHRIPNIAPILVESLKKLEYRGYDSAGFALIECGTGKLLVFKDSGRIDTIVNEYMVNRKCAVAGIAHTRWATHGPPNRVNAHPHLDCKGQIAVVHNGIIKNYLELRRELEARGHRFVSDTDTEVIPHLLEEELEKGLSMLEALRRLVARIEGSYAIVALYVREPNRLYFARNVSPLVIGVGRGFNVVSSDIPSFLKLTRDVIVINDGEIGFIDPDTIYIERRGVAVDALSRVRRVTWTAEDAEKSGYPHFMLKEIMEQPRALRETYLGVLSDDSIERAISLLTSANHVYVTGAGTSYHAALVYAYYMGSIASTLVTPFIASEYYVYSKSVRENDVLIAVSQSGETIDTLQALREFKRRGAKVIAVSNVVGSSIPRESDAVVYTRAGPEIGVAATKTFLTQVLTLQVLAIRYAESIGVLSPVEASNMVDQLSSSSRIARESLEASSAIVERIARSLMTAHSLYVLGRGLGVALALEAALKIKEVSYLHAEAYPAGESKHGPIALVEQGYPVIFIATPPDELVDRLKGNIEEMKARGAYTIVFSVVGGDFAADTVVKLPAADEILAPYALIPPLQLLAYRLAVLLGRDPDKPRNLAKTVTVE